MKNREDLLNRYLPKWPQCIITGTKISEEKALEIIRRTDYFFRSMYVNDKSTQKKIQSILHIPDFRSVSEKDLDSYYEQDKKWKKQWGYIHLSYLYNDWILCDMAQGAQGWCHPDGTIDYHYNVGKWPECREILEELEIIASNFPFLELECTLMDSEYCDEVIHPVISFLVRDGNVSVVDPDEFNVHEMFNRGKLWSYSEGEINKILKMMLTRGSDSSISMETIQSWTKYLE